MTFACLCATVGHEQSGWVAPSRPRSPVMFGPRVDSLCRYQLRQGHASPAVAIGDIESYAPTNRRCASCASSAANQGRRPSCRCHRRAPAAVRRRPIGCAEPAAPGEGQPRPARAYRVVDTFRTSHPLHSTLYELTFYSRRRQTVYVEPLLVWWRLVTVEAVFVQRSAG